MYRYVCGESSKLTIDVNDKWQHLPYKCLNSASDDAGKLKSTDRQSVSNDIMPTLIKLELEE